MEEKRRKRSRREGEDRRAKAGRRPLPAPRLKFQSRVLEGPGSWRPSSKARSDPAACKEKGTVLSVPGGWVGAREHTRLLCIARSVNNNIRWVCWRLLSCGSRGPGTIRATGLVGVDPFSPTRAHPRHGLASRGGPYWWIRHRRAVDRPNREFWSVRWDRPLSYLFSRSLCAPGRVPGCRGHLGPP